MQYEDYKQRPTLKLLTMIYSVRSEIEGHRKAIRASIKENKPVVHRLSHMVVLSMCQVHLGLMEELSRNLAEIDPARDEKIEELCYLFWDKYGKVS